MSGDDDDVKRMKDMLDSDNNNKQAALLEIMNRLFNNMAKLHSKHKDPDHVCATCYGWRPKDPEARRRRIIAESKYKHR